MEAGTMMLDVHTLRDRILTRSSYYMAPLSHAGQTLVTDGICGVLVGDGGGDHPEADQRVIDVLCDEPKRWHTAELSALRAWAGPVPVATVEPCPEWEDHEAFARGDDYGAECYYGCQYVTGLGYAYESLEPDFGCSWGNIAGLPIDRVRLAELLAPWDDGQVMYGHGNGGNREALYVRRGGLWRIVLMGGDKSVETVGQPFEECAR